MKIGKFYLPSYSIVRKSENKYNEAADILSTLRFVPFRVEHLYYSSRFLMEGISEKFDEVEEGQAIPFYDLIITNVDGELPMITAVKSNNQF